MVDRRAVLRFVGFARESVMRRLTGSFPFGSCINSNLLTNISECRVRKEDAAYQRLSEEAKHLILRFFDPDYLKRISLDELLISEFMMVHDNADDPDYYSCDQWAFRTVPGYSVRSSGCSFLL